MSKTNVRELREKFGRRRGDDVIKLVDKLDSIDYGPRYLANPVKEPMYGDLTPLTRRRLLKEISEGDI